ncbi:Glucose-repressible alcohol dehydrogenase transcriptional effector [Hondaea fermentalgiana]|uniref:Glucose-repressible alcohol dehydrogenase transcriptional effector n=1 Tax=Hondaea fermentalgiana TaxID=2315210 RepID=A0A2R5G4T7_9STRA|nr:Glucose-repressible alcohol dehydrogenase transcriptional effector [Hondaea fermentalgiana]|eukprot:GBG26042.1 Glucose-repressible alcohol dehydrogenase transcriptional effector [Hondaea fermentalgiana]
MASPSPLRRATPPTPIKTTGDASERLTVRLDQPIENVQLAAHTLLRGVDGGVLTPSTRRIEFKWSRSRTRRNCEYAKCPTPRETARMQSLLTGRRYCSGACLLADVKAQGGARPAVQEDMLLPAPAETTNGGKDSEDSERALIRGKAWRVRQFEEDESWIDVGSQKVYMPRREDVGHFLRVECRALVAEDGRVSTSQSRETAVVIGIPTENPRLCDRELLLSQPVRQRQSIVNYLKQEGGGAVLRVMTYNLLAEVYATKQLYSYCPMWALSWGYRKQLILQELRQHAADVICLQEMQLDHFDNYIVPELAKNGYQGIIKAKTREAMGRKGKIDGCAILYKRSRLHLVSQRAVEYNAIAMSHAAAGGFHRPELSQSENQSRTKRILSRLCRDNVAQIAIFETIPDGFDPNTPQGQAARQVGPQRVCVVATHIFWDPEYSDVKFFQTVSLMQEINHLLSQQQHHTSLIICGDLNSTPDSSVVRYLSQDAVDPNHPDMANDPMNILPGLAQVNHNLDLASAYEMVLGQNPETTNYTAHFSGCLDYIYVSAGSLVPLSILKIPDRKTLRGEEDTHIPNTCFPSDHVSLCVELNLVPQDRVRSRPVTPSPPSPSLSPALSMASSMYDPVHYHMRSLNKAQMHSPNPAMLSQQYQQHQQHQQHASHHHLHHHHMHPGDGRSNSPGLHPLSQHNSYHY